MPVGLWYIFVAFYMTAISTYLGASILMYRAAKYRPSHEIIQAFLDNLRFPLNILYAHPTWTLLKGRFNEKPAEYLSHSSLNLATFMAACTGFFLVLGFYSIFTDMLRHLDSIRGLIAGICLAYSAGLHLYVRIWRFGGKLNSISAVQK